MRQGHFMVVVDGDAYSVVWFSDREPHAAHSVVASGLQGVGRAGELCVALNAALWRTRQPPPAEIAFQQTKEARLEFLEWPPCELEVTKFENVAAFPGTIFCRGCGKLISNGIEVTWNRGKDRCLCERCVHRLIDLLTEHVTRVAKDGDDGPQWLPLSDDRDPDDHVPLEISEHIAGSHVEIAHLLGMLHRIAQELMVKGNVHEAFITEGLNIPGELEPDMEKQLDSLLAGGHAIAEHWRDQR